jgi:hypothetical protein
MPVNREYEAAGAYLVMKGFRTGSLIPAGEVQVLLANFHSENLDVVNAQFARWWKDNITHAPKES